MNGTPRDVKVVLLGDSGAGKSAILERFFTDCFDDDNHATIGIDFKHKTYRLKDDQIVRLQLWDTAGQERFRQLVPLYIREAHVAIIVFDLSDMDAETKIIRWIRWVERERGKSTKLVLVGNKSDLKTKKSLTQQHLEAKLNSSDKVVYAETSAKTGDHVKELFWTVANIPLETYKPDTNGIALHKAKKATPKDGFLCC